MDELTLFQGCDIAIQTKDKAAICININYLNRQIDSKKLSNSELLHFHYVLGNLYSELSLIENEEASGWRKEETYPINLNNSINHLRLALELMDNQKPVYEIQVNLANQLSLQQRNIESLELWVKPNFNKKGDAPFVSAYSQVKTLNFLSYYLDDNGHANYFRYTAYKLFKSLRSNLSKTDYLSLKKAIEDYYRSSNEIKFIEDNITSFKGFDSTRAFSQQDKSEKKYRTWCLKNKLFTNPLNCITENYIADQDVLQFPSHIVTLNDGPWFSGAFSSLKREYCFARWLAYEGIHNIHPKYEEKALYLTDTLDSIYMDGATEKL